MANEKKDLVQIIRDNPGCTAVIDNDYWVLLRAPPKPEDEMTEDDWDAFDDDPDTELAQSGDVMELGDGGYGSGHCYGGDLLQALAIIVGIKVRSV